MGSYFDMLEFAGDEASGAEAVALVAAQVVKPAAPKEEGKDKKGPKKGPKDQQQPQEPQQQPQQPQPQYAEGEEYPREDNYRGGYGRGQGPVGGHQGGGGYQGDRGRGNGRIFFDADGNRYYDKSGNGGYNGNYNGDRGNYNNGYRGNYNNGGYNNGGNRGYNNGYGNVHRGDNNGYANGNGGDHQVSNENSGQFQQGGNGGDYYPINYSNNGERQGYRRNDGQPRREYRPKSKPSSEAASDVDQKSEGKVEPAAAEAPQKEAAAENVDAVPASESGNSAGDVAKDDSKKEGGEGSEKKEGEGAAKKEKKNPNVKSLSGSAKRKLKKKNPKKEDKKEGSNDGEVSKKTTDNEPEVIVEEKQEMTLEEYEKALGKKQSLEPSKTEEKKTAPLEYEGGTLLEKKKVDDDDRLKVENAQRKAKEVAAKEGKARKLTIQEYLKPADGSEYVPPPPPSGGYRGGDGGFRGRSRDNSTEPRVHNSGRGYNPIVFHNVVANNGNGAPRRDGSQERRDGGYQQGRYNGARGNGGYQERREGGYQQGGYNGGRGNGSYQERQQGQQSGNQDHREAGYQQGDERRQGAYQQGGNQERREGGYQQGNGGYQERRQGGYQGGYNGGRGNGGYQQGGGRGNGGGPMVLFKDGQHVRLRCCVHGTYLHANEDGRGVSLHRYPACMNSLWVVHYRGDPHSVRLYSAAYGCYLAATNKSASLGCDGFRVELSTYHSQEEALSWQALLTDSGPDRLFLCNIGVRCGSLSSSGRYLRANGRWNLKTVSLGEMSNITNMMEWVVEPIRDMEPHRWSYFHANGKFLPWNDKKGGVDYIKLPIRPRPRRPLHLPFLRPSRIVVFVGNHQWPRFWFTFEGRSVHRLRSELISRLGVTSDNLVMYIRGWKYGRFTPLVVDLPRGTRTVVVTAEMRVNGWLLYTGKHRR